ncbi:MAG: M48 family metallopeptidase [Anaerolineales bacterium]|nr:M48 family metallopeptidase [Anaerolineales bacterium]
MVVVPRHYRTGDLEQLLRKKQGWILKNIARCNTIPIPFHSDDISAGDTVPYLGQQYQVRLSSNHRSECNIRLENNAFLIEGKCGNGTAALALKRWLYGRAHTYMAQRACELAASLRVRYNRIFIRGQRTRWGSCSSQGNISLNWKLIMFPPHIIDYVIIHELAHLVVMGHSKAYWDVVAAHCPDWKSHRQWIRKHEGYLSISV